MNNPTGEHYMLKIDIKEKSDKRVIKTHSLKIHEYLALEYCKGLYIMKIRLDLSQAYVKVNFLCLHFFNEIIRNYKLREIV